MIGQVFTPLRWAEWAISMGPYQRWLDGGTVLDPTGGCGNFLEAFISTAVNDGIEVTADLLSRLHMVEFDGAQITSFQQRVGRRHGLAVPRQNLICDDYLAASLADKYDAIVGNPPWCNYADLPADYKAVVKPLFIKYGLVTDLKTVLWGGTRIDIAALITAKALLEDCADGAVCALYLPTSLLFNHGAHDDFRKLATSRGEFAIDQVHGMTQLEIFAGVATRYCLAILSRGGCTTFPVTYIEHAPDAAPSAMPANPMGPRHSCWVIGQPPKVAPITVPRACMPRQGINTGGANDVFFFSADEVHRARLERGLVHPLITSKNFAPGCTAPAKYVLVPHDDRGKPLPGEVLQRDFPLTWRYLKLHRQRLRSRKGKMIHVQIDKGAWWALLGVGAYSFREYKIVWESYGKAAFNPVLFEGAWIANQSLQAYMSFDSRQLAVDVLEQLRGSNIEAVLRASQTAGTASWAQPGKIKQFLNLVPDQG